MSERPFKILGVQQIAVGHNDKNELRNFWVDMLGLRFSHTFTSENENVDEDICEIGEGDFAVEVDLMQPLDPERKPRVNEPALNHIGLWVDHLEAAVAWLDQQGVRFTPGGIRKGASGHNIIFIHPKGNDDKPLCGQGVLIELVQAPQSVVKAFSTIANA